MSTKISDAKKETNPTKFPFGYYEDCTEASVDLSQMTHLIVGGGAKEHWTDQFVQKLVTWLCQIRTHDQQQLVLVDSTRKGLARFADDPHLVVPVIDKCNRAVFALHWAVAELERRMKILADEGNLNALPDIAVVIAETEELLPNAGDAAAHDLIELAQKAHQFGIHLVLATERPSATSLPKTVKDCIVGRVVFRVADRRASKWILGEVGTERIDSGSRGEALVHNGADAPVLMMLETSQTRRSKMV